VKQPIHVGESIAQVKWRWPGTPVESDAADPSVDLAVAIPGRIFKVVVLPAAFSQVLDLDHRLSHCPNSAE
jgi:hypothetical protein